MNEGLVAVELIAIAEEVEKARRRGAPTENAVQLENVLFNMPVRFLVRGVDLSPPSGSEPVVYLARAVPYQLRYLRVGITQELRFPSGGELLLTLRSDEELTLTCPVRRRTAHARQADVLEAWTRFAEVVRQLLLAEFPALRDHPELGAWFKGEAD